MLEVFAHKCLKFTLIFATAYIGCLSDMEHFYSVKPFLTDDVIGRHETWSTLVPGVPRNMPCLLWLCPRFDYCHCLAIYNIVWYRAALQQWNDNVVILTTFSLLVVSKFVMLTAFGAASGKNVIKIILRFQWTGIHSITWQHTFHVLYNNTVS